MPPKVLINIKIRLEFTLLFKNELRSVKKPVHQLECQIILVVDVIFKFGKRIFF